MSRLWIFLGGVFFMLNTQAQNLFIEDIPVNTKITTSGIVMNQSGGLAMSVVNNECGPCPNIKYLLVVDSNLEDYSYTLNSVEPNPDAYSGLTIDTQGNLITVAKSNGTIFRLSPVGELDTSGVTVDSILFYGFPQLMTLKSGQLLGFSVFKNDSSNLVRLLEIEKGEIIKKYKHLPISQQVLGYTIPETKNGLDLYILENPNRRVKHNILFQNSIDWNESFSYEIQYPDSDWLRHTVYYKELSYSFLVFENARNEYRCLISSPDDTLMFRENVYSESTGSGDFMTSQVSFSDQGEFIVSGFKGLIYGESESFVEIFDSLGTLVWDTTIRYNDYDYTRVSYANRTATGDLVVVGSTRSQGGTESGVFVLRLPAEETGYPISTEISENFESNNKLKAYPNPVQKRGVLRFSKAISGVVYSIDGKQVATLQNQNVFNVPNLTKGVYILETNDSERIKLVVE